MKERDFEEINRFLTTVGKATLFDYLSLDTAAPTAQLEQAIKTRRSWAQSQQANPKYRGEALWVIKNVRLLRLTLLDKRQIYLEHLDEHAQTRGLEVLSLFIRGTLAGGSLTAAGEAAILAQGSKLGLSEDAVLQRINELANEQGINSGGDHGSENLPDHYSVLGVLPSATPKEVDAAYREKYRWARTLADTRRAREEYARIDAALRDLKDPSRRAAYDVKYRRQFPGVAAFEIEGTDGFLPPPSEDMSQSAFSVDHTSSSISAASYASAHERVKRDTTEPPGTLPPMRMDRTANSAHSAPHGSRAVPGTLDLRTASAPPGTRPITVPPGVRAPSLTPTPTPTPRPSPVPVFDSSASSQDSAPSASIPRPPDRFTGKTLSLGAQRGGTRIDLLTPQHLYVRVGRRPAAITIKLKQVGTGTVTGRILADRDWVTIDPTRLETGRTQHEVHATVHPDRMPRQRGSSIVTIVPSHGPRIAVTLDAEKERAPRVARLAALGVVAVGVVAMLGFAATQLGLFQTPGPRVVSVTPNPEMAVVYINGEMVGVGPRTVQGADLPEGQLRLKVALDGFQTFEQLVDPQPDQPVSLTPRLELDRPLDFRPTDGQQGLSLPAAVVNAQLQAVHGLIDDCFSSTPTAPASFTLQAYVGFSGHVQGVRAVAPENVSPDFLACTSRGLRAMIFVLSEPADYWTFGATLRPPGLSTPK